MGRQLRPAHGASLEVIDVGVAIQLRVVDDPVQFRPEHDSETLLTEALKPVRDSHPGVTIQTSVLEGHPAPVLVKASDGADLLVVGSRGHGEFAGMLLGSVSEHCVSNARCPVLVLRDRG